MRDETASTIERESTGTDAHLLRVAVDAAVDGVILIDASGRVLMFNPACERLFGYSAAEVMGQNVRMLMPSRPRDEHVEDHARTNIKKVMGIGREAAGLRKDGTTFPMKISIGEAKEDGKPIFVGIIHDFTESEPSGRDARQGDAHLLHAASDADLDGVILIDGSGHIQMFNPRGGIRRIIGIGRELTGQRKDSTLFPADLSAGEAKQDIADREIRDGAARLDALVNTGVDGVILIDAAGIVGTFNSACEMLFGYRAEEVVGKNVSMLIPMPIGKEHDTYLSNFHETGVRKTTGTGREVIGRRHDGSTFPMNLSVGEARQDGESIYVGIIHDLTEHKHTEEQLIHAQKMEAVGHLSGGIAHDFNNLLTVIVGNAEFLSEELNARADLQRLAEAIVKAGERGAELTQRLLAYGRRQTLHPVEIDCNALVTGMRKLMRRTLTEEIEISVSLEPDLAAAFADAGQLENAILNLAINAKDAMPEGGIISIATANMHLDERYNEQHPEVHPGPYVMIAITDTGRGMPKSVLDRAFEPFFTTKDVGKGSGLGLSMVYGFVKQSNGHVAIYSEPGLGTTVRIYLPATNATAEKAPSVPEPDDVAVGRETVLIAEDDPFVRTYAVACLESFGYRVIEATDGRDAFNKLAGGTAADLLFTDVVMPGGINGWELAETARRIQPNLKVLLTSGYALEALAEGGRLPAGAVILNKPYRKAELARRVREALSAPDRVTRMSRDQ